MKMKTRFAILVCFLCRIRDFDRSANAKIDARHPNLRRNFRWFCYGAIAGLLCALLASQPLRAAEPDVIPELCVALVVVGVGTVVIINLNGTCNRQLPPAPPDDPPPPPPDPPFPPCPPFPQWPLPRPGAAVVNSPTAATMLLSDANVRYLDISKCDLRDTNSLPYRKMFSLAFQSSTNLLNWSTEYCATGWVSSAMCVIVSYTNGVPSMTNSCRAGGSIGVWLAPDDAAQKFYRLKP